LLERKEKEKKAEKEKNKKTHTKYEKLHSKIIESNKERLELEK
jgi:hypothetical protein